jgi:hypothetical protein
LLRRSYLASLLDADGLGSQGAALDAFDDNAPIVEAVTHLSDLYDSVRY